MNLVSVVISVAVLMVAIEVLFFIYCFRWLAGGKRQRERDFARLDTERGELLALQSSLQQDLSEARQIAAETLGKLNRVGADAHAEWNEMIEKIQAIAGEVEEQMKALMSENMGQLSMRKLSVDKCCQEAHQYEAKLIDQMKAAQRIIRFFDKSIPSDQIIKDIQTEKYAEAKNLLEKGTDPSLIAKRLSMSLGEVSLLSHMARG